MKKVVDINRLSGRSNLPDLNRVRVIDVTDVLTLKLPHRVLPLKVMEGETLVMPEGHSVVDGGITLKAGAGFTNLYFAPGQGNFAESLVTTPHGELWQGSLDILCPGDTADVRAAVEALKNRRFLVLFMDNDSVVRLMGTDKQPCEVSIGFSTSGVKGRKISFSCLTKRQAYFMYGWTNDEITGVNSEFSVEFNLEFTA